MDEHFTIFEDFANVGSGALMSGDEHDWETGPFKNFLKKQEQDHCILVRNKFSYTWYFGIRLR